MWLFQVPYRLAERFIFNTIPRKVLACMVPILLLLLVLDGCLLQVVGACRAAAGTPATLLLLARAETAAKGIPLLALALAAGAYVTFRLSVLVPLRQVSAIIRGDDFSRDITLSTHDEIRGLADGFNRFSAKIRDILDNSKRLGLSIAVGASRTTKLAADSARDAKRQGELSTDITGTSQGVAGAVGAIVARPVL